MNVCLSLCLIILQFNMIHSLQNETLIIAKDVRASIRAYNDSKSIENECEDISNFKYADAYQPSMNSCSDENCAREILAHCIDPYFYCCACFQKDKQILVLLQCDDKRFEGLKFTWKLSFGNIMGIVVTAIIAFVVVAYVGFVIFRRVKK